MNASDRHSFTTGDVVRYRSGFGSKITFNVLGCTYVESELAYELTVDGQIVPGYVSLERLLELSHKAQLAGGN